MKKGFLPKLYLALVIAFFYLPIFYVILFSFNDSRSLSNFTGFSLKWYYNMFANRTMMEAIYYTVVTAVIATIVSTIVGTVAAIGLSKSKKIVKEVVTQVNNLPMLNPEIVTAIGLMLFFTSLNIKAGFGTLLLSHIIFCIPYVMLSIMPKLRQLDDNMVEAALDLGCTPFEALVKVIIPQIMPGIVSGALIAFTMSFDDFVISYFVTGPGINNISTYVYSSVKRINPNVNALSTIIIIAITIILIIVNVLPMINNKKIKHTIRNAAVLMLSGMMLVLSFNFFNTKSGGSDVYGCDVLNVYNVGEYIGEDTIANFENEYGVKVNYSLFASNEEMYTKLLGGTVYDVMVPSDYMIERLIAEDMLQPIDKDYIPNLDNLYEGTLNKGYDPDNTYSVPYFWGNVGIVYDETLVDTADVESQGWEVLKNEKYNGMLYMYDSERDSFMVALKALGYSMNTTNVDELNEAYEWLIDLDRKMDPAYVTDEAIDGLAYGEKAMGVMYSGDAAYILSENENMRYFVPEEGTNIWTDAMVIHKDSKCQRLANEFMNYILDYEVALENSTYVGYASVHGEVLEELVAPGGDFEGNEAYLPRTGNPNDEEFKSNEDVRKIISELWVKVKNS